MAATRSDAETADDHAPPHPRRSRERSSRCLQDRQPARTAPASGQDDAGWYVGVDGRQALQRPARRPRPDAPASIAARPCPITARRGPAASSSTSTSGSSTSSSPTARPSAMASASAGRAFPGGHGHCRTQGRVARMVAHHRRWSASSRNCRATAKPASTTRSEPAPSTSTRTAATSSSASTAPTSPGASANKSRRAASGMLNEDVVDLYNRVPVGTTVYVKRFGRYRV